MSRDKPELVEISPQVYRDPRPKEYFDKYHRYVRENPPDFVYGVVRLVVTPLCKVLYRAQPVSVDNVPGQGPLIIAPNHFSAMDHFLVGIFLKRQVQFMSKSQLFRWPVQTIFKHGGVFPVRRGMRDEEAFITANTILGRDGAVGMYCEGGRSRTGEIAKQAKPGIGRLTLESGATVLPVAVCGSERVRNWRRFSFPKVTVSYGVPLNFGREENPSRERQQEVADQILESIRGLYNELSEAEAAA